MSLSFIGRASCLFRRCTNFHKSSLAPYACARAVASFPSPGTDRVRKKTSRKKYNFLNSERLVKESRGPRSRREVRIRDDVFFHRRVQYREAIGTNVEKHIRYFPENVKQYVFFKNKVNSIVCTGFNGARRVPGHIARRILLLAENEILKPENRDHLVELIESAGVTPPTEEEWARYTDKKTGEININLYYHDKVEKHMRQLFTGKNACGMFKRLQAFIVLKRNDFNICPPMREWALRQGPLQDEDLIERGEVKDKRDVTWELAQFQRPHIEEEFTKLKDEMKEKYLREAMDNVDQLRCEYEQERLFSAKVLSGVAALKETRALTIPAVTYYRHEHYKYVIREGGSVEATMRRSKDEVPKWHMIPREQRIKFYCFERAMEMHPVGGAHLFARYAGRDYGITRDDAMIRWSMLSDLQKAALNFCFYAPISPAQRSITAFRRFYWKQCHIHGLMMTGKACGNRAFFERMRKVWANMSADERAQYEDTESFSSVFPLHPKSASGERRRNGVSNTDSKVYDKVFATQSSSGESSAVGGANGVSVVLDGKRLQAVSEEDEKDLFYFEDEVIGGDEEDGMSSCAPSTSNDSLLKKHGNRELTVTCCIEGQAVAFSV